MKRLLAPLVIVAAGALLGSCGGDEHKGLRQELAEATKDFRGQVPPLPQVKAYEPVPYTAEGMTDPFRPERLEVARTDQPEKVNAKLAEQEKRVKEPLEAFPLESIQMLGTITQEKETFALVKAGPNLYRVRKGMYMGQNFGVITSIDEVQISLKELVQDSGGEWVERASTLQLVEAKR
jgi:type IV pilus assembly protein PilP